MIPKQMIAVAKTKNAEGGELVDVDVPTIRPHEVLVKVHATAICGTDAHIFSWNNWAENRIKNIPQIMGHELAGEVILTGDAVSTVKTGDFVSAETHINCGYCIQCLSDQKHICANLEILGVDRDGSFAEYIAVPENVIWKNDPSIPPGIAAAQEPLGNAIYCTLVESVTGKSVVIFGDGPTGLLATGVAKTAGASAIILVGLDEFRLDIGKKMGADHILHFFNADIDKIIKDATNGYGADVVLEMAGVKDTIRKGFEVVRKGGRYCAFGISSSDVEIDYNQGIVFKGLTLYGINGRLMFDTWQKSKELLRSGKLDISPVITHHLPLTEFEKGFELMLTEPRVAGKIVLYPDTSFMPKE
ncbi:L-threonine 3-dehydrogenase [candidate division KSB1 bacterium]